MKEFLAAAELELGMFVAELDRPWLETPFLMQGFLIESDQQLAQLRGLCRIVLIDRERSESRHMRAKVVAPNPPAPALPPTERPLTMVSQAAPTDFFQLLKLLKAYDSESAETVRGEAPVFAWSVSRGARSVGGTELEPGPVAQAGVWAWLRARARKLRRREASSEAESDVVEDISSDHPYPIDVPLEQELLAAAPIHAEAMLAVKDILRDVERQAPPDLGRAREVVQDMMHSVTRHPDALLWLTRLKRTDRYTYDHALDCSTYMMVFARHLGLPQDRIAMLGMAGMLFDIGKLRLSARLLAKATALTPLEYDLFKTHVDSAVQILRADASIDLALVDVVARHHERLDGSGYPSGLSGEAIGVFGEMAGIVDTFCAMTRHRSWRPALSSQQGLEALIGLRDERFSAGLVDQFVQCIGIYPAGTLVELNSGEVAVVVAQNRIRRLKPRVMVLLAHDHSPNANPHTIDLLYDPVVPGREEAYRIARSLPEGAFGIDPTQFYLA
ncbi:HD-GYP domain-containing protein [Niveibacterium sp.]|uniref:HD-GYP domain-containing protein n=1 Tax=Niveibacterium sp. TaxID=2017444 RepID=UPI0035B31C9D